MDDISRRKHLTFEQAEGVEPLPEQLKLRELSQQLRARLWQAIYLSISENVDMGSEIFNEPEAVTSNWLQILYDKHVSREHKMADEFDNRPSAVLPSLKLIFSKGDYAQVFGFVQWVLRHPSCPYALSSAIDGALEDSRAAYRVVDEDTIVPIASDEELDSLKRAFDDVAASEFSGARRHLRNAASELGAGNWSASVRESIHAVGSVARMLDATSNTLTPALSSLEKSIRVHSALKTGFGNLYGYTSDERGVRHALLDQGAPQVDETDALYMLGSCAAFVSYLINKARLAGFLKD